MRNEGKVIGVVAEVGRELYEESVVARMEGRAGAYSQKGAAGNALEIMANDRCNVKNMCKPDTVTKLTKSSTATQVDAVTLKAGKVVERIQYKDTVSPSGIQKTLNQVKAGKYQQAQLRGTVEAAEKYNAAAKASGVSKTMQSTGISHNATQRVGDKFTGQPIKPASLVDAMKSTAVFAATTTATVEAIKSAKNGDSVGEYVSHVVAKGAESVITATTATVAAEMAMSVMTIVGIPGIVPTIATTLVVEKAVSDMTEGKYDETGEVVGDAVEDVVNDVKDAVSIGSDLARDIASEVGDTARDVANEVGDTVRNVASEAGDVISDVVDGVGDVVFNALGGILGGLFGF